MLKLKLSEVLDNPRLARSIWNRIYTQEFTLESSFTQSAFQVDKGYSFYLTGITGMAVYEDNTSILDDKYLPQIGITDSNYGNPLNGSSAEDKSNLNKNFKMSEMTPKTTGLQLREPTPIQHYLENNGVIETEVTRLLVNPNPGKSIIKVFINYIGYNMKNNALRI